MSKIIVSGNAGFIASHLVNKLIEQGNSTIGIDNLSGGFKENINDKVEHWYDDLRDEKAVNTIFNSCRERYGEIDAVFHAAADATEGRSFFTPRFCADNNLIAFINLIKACIRIKVKRIILFSSMSVYGEQEYPFDETFERNPADPYGIYKAAMENLCECLAPVYGFEYVIVRPHNIVNSPQRLDDPFRNVVGIWVNCLLRDKAFYIYGDGNSVRAWSNVGDVVDALVKCLDAPISGEIINLGAKTPNTLNELAAMVREEFELITSKKTKEPVYMPGRPGEVKIAYSTVQKSIDLLGYKETKTLREAVREFIEWAYKKYPYGVTPKYSVPLELINEKTPSTWVNQLI